MFGILITGAGCMISQSYTIYYIMEEDYNEKIAGENVASFNEFIDAIIVFVEQNGGTLEDAIIMANDTYYQL